MTIGSIGSGFGLDDGKQFKAQRALLGLYESTNQDYLESLKNTNDLAQVTDQLILENKNLRNKNKRTIKNSILTTCLGALAGAGLGIATAKKTLIKSIKDSGLYDTIVKNIASTMTKNTDNIAEDAIKKAGKLFNAGIKTGYGFVGALTVAGFVSLVKAGVDAVKLKMKKQ